MPHLDPLSLCGSHALILSPPRSSQASRSVVRCNCVQPDPRSGTRLVNDEHISLYVEFNTSFRLTVEDTKGMPPSEKKVRTHMGRIDLDPSNRPIGESFFLSHILLSLNTTPHRTSLTVRPPRWWTRSRAAGRWSTSASAVASARTPASASRFTMAACMNLRWVITLV